MMLLLVFLWLLQDDFAVRRARMVEEDIAGRGIRDPRVLRAMRQVPRHEFVLPEHRTAAYEDHPLPIGHGATISQPFIVAYMSEALRVEPTHKVLEVGTGSGYQAAILSLLARQVYTIELVPELAENAARRLRRLGYLNVQVRVGDGYKGWPEAAPFDRIMLTAAPDDVPQELLDQLKPGGRLVAPIGKGLNQYLVAVDKKADGSIVRQRLLDVRFVPMVRPRQTGAAH